MAFPSQEQIDIIATKILFDAKEAIQMLRGWNNELTTAEQKVRLFKGLVSSTAKQMGGDMRAATSAVSKFSNALNVNPAAVRKLGSEGESAFKRIFSSVNSARIALGALTSVLLFQAIQAITSFFTDAIDQARQFEATLYRISNAERQLSMEGIEVSVEQLKKGIADIQKALPIFSKEDVAQLVGSVATTTKELGLTGDEILKLSAAIAVLNINSTETETLLQTQAKVTNSLLSPQAKSIGNLGLAFGKAKIEAKAYQSGILEVGESYDDLTEKEKTLIKYAIVLETANLTNVDSLDRLKEKIKETGGDFEALNSYLQSNDARLQENSAAWMDLKTSIGQVILPFLPALTTFFNLIENGFTMGKFVLIEWMSALGTAIVMSKLLFSGQIDSIDQFKKASREAFKSLHEDLTNTFFPTGEFPEAVQTGEVPEWVQRRYGSEIKKSAETATAAIQEMYDTTEDSGDAEDALKAIDEKIQDIILDAKQARDDLDLKLEQKQADLDTEYQRKNADAMRDHQNKISDINQDAREKEADAKQKARQDELKDEQDLLQKLKELRSRFLLDLEEALHARDARQVLRLMKEYKLEKQNLLDQAKLKDQQRKMDLEAELKSIELERQRRIESENIEYQRKLADLRLAKQREEEELQLWYQREQEDIERNIQQKLEKLLAGYIAEEKIHETEQAKIYAILAKYFAADMALVDQMAQFMATRFSQLSSMQYPMMSPYLVGGQPTTTAQKAKTDVQFQRHNFAEGGTMIANRPTSVMFGEKGLEMATFTPLERSGRDVGRLFGDVAGGGVGGTLMVGVDLSPDLEGRIVQNSISGVANVVTKVNRRKQ